MPPNSADLYGTWIIIDSAQKPVGEKEKKQMYANDPFASLLSILRDGKKIKSRDDYMYIPNGSRFGISYDEITRFVNPGIAELLRVKPEQVRLPKTIEFNILGNLFHPEWGQTNTVEWLTDTTTDGSHFVGGFSQNGGLSSFYTATVSRDDRIGFRPMIVFP